MPLDFRHVPGLGSPTDDSFYILYPSTVGSQVDEVIIDSLLEYTDDAVETYGLKDIKDVYYHHVLCDGACWHAARTVAETFHFPISSFFFNRAFILFKKEAL